MSPFERLGLTEDAALIEVQTAWRRLAKLHHPDMGGSTDSFHELRVAYNEAMREIESRPCPTCRGVGRVTHAHGFSTLQATCPCCGGTGLAVDGPSQPAVD